MASAVMAKSEDEIFFREVCQARDRVLFLDYDGTIAPFSAHRNQAFPYPTIPELLDCIMSTCRTRVALVSGRAAREIPALLGVCRQPEIWGSHGTEYLSPDGEYRVFPMSDEALRALAEADRSLQERGLDGLAEAKPGAVAVHWRGLRLGQAEDVRAEAYRTLAPFADNAELMLAEFDGGLELRLRKRNKADAVRATLADYDDTVPVAYLGDDQTDEDAFRALHGRGLTVLVRPTYRFTAAQIWLRPPEDLVQFLSNWVHVCGGDL